MGSQPEYGTLLENTEAEPEDGCRGFRVHLPARTRVVGIQLSRHGVLFVRIVVDTPDETGIGDHIGRGRIAEAGDAIDAEEGVERVGRREAG